MSFQGILYGIVRTTVESALLNVSVDVTILTFKGVVSMLSSPVQIMAYAAALPEGALMHPKMLLHLGARAAIDQALSRLAKNGSLMRVCHGIYVCPVETRFGPRPPATEKVLASLSALWGETIVPCGGTAANALGLTTQMPVQSVYLTSGPNRKLTLGEVTVNLRHAPRWQLAAPHRPAGEAVRALSWLGPDEVEVGLDVIGRKLSSEDLGELAALRAILPTWIAEPASALVAES